MTNSQDPQREIYFFIPSRGAPFLNDSRAMQSLAAIHKNDKVDAVILNTERNFPIVRNYCSTNSIQRIDVRQDSDRDSLMSKLLGSDYIDYHRVVYITLDRDDLEEDAKKLRDYDFNVEIDELY